MCIYMFPVDIVLTELAKQHVASQQKFETASTPLCFGEVMGSAKTDLQLNIFSFF